MVSRHNARKKNAKRKEVSKVKFIANFNSALPSIESLIKKHIRYLHSDEVLKKAFLSNKFSVIYKRSENLKEMVAPSSYPKPSIKSNHTTVSCNKCDICKNFLITDSKFRCKVIGKTYFIKGSLSFDSCNVIYLITCSNCREQYVGSAINFKQRFRIHKSDIKTNQDRCGTARHFNNKCCSPNNKHAYLKVQIIEKVFNNNQYSTEDLLWELEKYWQVQLFTNLHGVNINDLHSMKYEKKRLSEIIAFELMFSIFNDILNY